MKKRQVNVEAGDLNCTAHPIAHPRSFTRNLAPKIQVAHGFSASVGLMVAGLWLFISTFGHCDAGTPWPGRAMTTIEIKAGSGHIYNNSQDRGERDLHQLAISEEREDAWLYFTNTWIDVGSEETKRTITLQYG
jgi:hypothetical protein